MKVRAVHLWHRIALYKEKVVMIRLLEEFGIVKDENNDTFKKGPFIVMLVLMLIFIGSSIYVLTSSLS